MLKSHKFLMILGLLFFSNNEHVVHQFMLSSNPTESVAILKAPQNKMISHLEIFDTIGKKILSINNSILKKLILK